MPVGFNLNDFRQMIGNLNYGDVTIRNGKLEKINNGRIIHALNCEFFRTKPTTSENADVREKFYKAVADEVNAKYGKRKKISETLLDDIRDQLGLDETKHACKGKGETRLERATIKKIVGLVDSLRVVNRQIEDDAMAELRGIVYQLDPEREESEVDDKTIKDFFAGDPPENYEASQTKDFNRGKGICNTLKMFREGKFANSIHDMNSNTSHDNLDPVEYALSIQKAFARNANAKNIGHKAIVRMELARDELGTIDKDWTTWQPFIYEWESELSHALKDPAIVIDHDDVIRYIHRYESRIIAKFGQSGSLELSNERSRAREYGKLLAHEFLKDNGLKKFGITDEDGDFDAEDVAGSSDVKINEVKDVAEEAAL